MVKKLEKIPNFDNAGILTIEQLKKTPGYPKETDFDKGLVAVIECDEDIPCNPCESICPNSAIKVGSPITNLPEMNSSKCNGCLKCLAVCPGLCIFAVERNHNEKNALIYITYEYLPLPERGMKIRALDRRGEFVCKGTVYKVIKHTKKQNSSIVGILVPGEFYDVIRNFEL